MLRKANMWLMGNLGMNNGSTVQENMTDATDYRTQNKTYLDWNPMQDS